MTGSRAESDAPILEIGGTHVTSAWIGADWQVTRGRRVDVDGGWPAAEIIAAVAEAARALDAPGGRDWGIAVPGPFDYAGGIAHYVGVGKFDSLRGVDVRGALTAAIYPTPGRLGFINDASAFLVGEWLTGAARGADASTAVTLGTGVGSAFLRDGAVVDDGDDVPPDGEVHLLVHDGRPLEDWVSRRAIRRRYADRAGLDAMADLPDVHEIADRARAGDPVAAEVFSFCFDTLGRALGPWLTRFGAEVLVVGGSISGAWDLVAGPLRSGLVTGGAGGTGLRRAVDAERSALVGAAYPVHLLHG